MENENNNMNQNNMDSTYHYGRNESPFGREDISGKVAGGDTAGAQQSAGYNNSQAYNQQHNTYQSSGTNPYSQGNVYGQGIYTGNDFGDAAADSQKKKEKAKKARKEKKPSSGKLKKAGLLIGSAAVFGLVAGGVMVGVNAVGNQVLGNDTKKTAEISTVTTTDSGVKSSGEDDVSTVVENVMPSMVSITNTSVQTVRSWFQSYEQEVQGSGSGIIIGQTDDTILVATNNHVIEGAKEITVAFCDETASAATVKGSDSSADLAVLEIKTSDMESDTLSKIKVAALGSSDDLKLGETAIAIGNALGYGQSVTVGHISALDREVDTEDKTMKMLQTDAAINPGNSGGALLNANGEVIGINTVKYVDSTVEGMGYAIPISTAIPIINDLMNQEVIEESEQGYLGIQGNDITDEYAKNFNMPTGVYVSKIVEDSPADQCGLKAGDIITKFADREVGSMETLQNILTNKKAGEEVEMVVQRSNEKGEYKEVTLKVTLGAKKDMPNDSKEKKTEQSTEQNPQYNNEMTPDEFFDEFFND